MTNALRIINILSHAGYAAARHILPKFAPFAATAVTNRKRPARGPAASPNSAMDGFLPAARERRGRAVHYVHHQVAIRHHRHVAALISRSEERRVGKEGRSRW